MRLVSPTTSFIWNGSKPMDKDTERLAVFVHGTLAALHLLGIVYNVRKKNWLDVAAHTAACAYDTHAALHHQRKIEAADEATTESEMLFV